MLMPNVTDLLVGRPPELPVPDEIGPRSLRASRPRDRGGVVRRLGRMTSRLLSLFL